jgi:hypothetical protein
VSGNDGDDLAPKEVRNRDVAWMLASGMTQHQVREAVGCSERTIRRLKADPHFRQLLHEARRERMEEANRKIPNLTDEALDTLAELMREGTQTIQLGAVRTILALGARLEADEMADRIARLERALQSETGWTPDALPSEGLDDDVDA